MVRTPEAVPLRAVVALVMASVPLTPAVFSAQQRQVVERVEVTRVLIDARVVDGTGQPVLGLEAADFEVEIDGKAVRVELAQWVGGERSPTDTLPATELSGVVVPEPRGRLIVFLVQKSLERSRVVGLLRMLRESGRLLEQLTLDDRVAVLSFDSHLKTWLDFTGDLDRVREVLAHDVMFEEPRQIEPARGPSLLTRLSPARGRQTSSIEEALRLVGNALEPLPGSKSVVLVGHGFGEVSYITGLFGARLHNYEEVRAALHAARAAVFSLDVTNADYHTLELGLQTVAADTGGFFARTHIFPERALDRVANALVGHYTLFTEKPEVEPGTHPITVRLVRERGTVFARSAYVE